MLKTYMGHGSFKETAYYLHLTADVFSEITLKIETQYPELIPELGGNTHETN
jgi:integrase/recombinase XerD